MRTIQFIAGLVCLVLSLNLGLFVLGGFHWTFAVCAIGLAWIGWFLIARRNSPKTITTKTLIALVFCLCVGFIVAVVIPNFIRARYETAANACINNLRQIDSAAQQFALEKAKKTGDAINYPDDLTPYIKLDSKGNPPKCPAGGTYTIVRVGEDPKCSIGISAWPNEHVLNGTNSWWIDFKEAYRILFGLRKAPLSNN